jgi:hypothetical protein
MAKKQYGSSKKYHYIYKTTNKLNGKYYIGMHSTNNLNDDYIGSGTLLKRSLNKYGKENYNMEILYFFNTREELQSKEKEIITLQEIAKKECMNLKIGGIGGFPPNAKVAFKEKLKDPEYRADFIKKSKCIEKLKKIREEGKIVKNTFLGKKHSEETKQKMSEIKKGKNKGKDNSQFNTMWITNGKENKKIKNTDKIPNNWNKGRVLLNKIAG